MASSGQMHMCLYLARLMPLLNDGRAQHHTKGKVLAVSHSLTAHERQLWPKYNVEWLSAEDYGHGPSAAFWASRTSAVAVLTAELRKVATTVRTQRQNPGLIVLVYGGEYFCRKTSEACKQRP